MDGFVHFYFHWLRVFGGWLIVLILAILPTVWLFNDGALRLLPMRWWRLAALLSFLLFLPTLLLGLNAGLNPDVIINTRRPEAQFSAASALVMVALIWVMVGSYIVIYWGMVGSESGEGVYQRGQPDPYLTRAQVTALGDQPYNEETLFPQQAYALAVLIEQPTQKRYPLLKGQTRLGRSRQNDIVLTYDRTISRRHGMIWETSGTYVLHNYATENPILYNGQPMTQGQTCILRYGDLLQLGRTQLVFAMGS